MASPVQQYPAFVHPVLWLYLKIVSLITNQQHNMARFFLQVLLLSAMSLLISCGGRNYDTATDPVTAMYDSIAKADSLRKFGTPREISLYDLKNQEMGIRVAMEGYIRIGSTITEKGTTTYLELWERKNQMSGEVAIVQIEIGTDKNQRAPLTDSVFKQTDFKVKDDNDRTVFYNDYVRIVGLVAQPHADGLGRIEVQTIESVMEKGFDYEHADAVPLVYNSETQQATDGQMVVVSGFIHVPIELTTSDVMPLEIYQDEDHSYRFTINVLIGNSGNHVEQLPDEYSFDDLRVRTFDNKIVENEKAVVFGIWRDGQVDVEYIRLAKN